MKNFIHLLLILCTITACGQGKQKSKAAEKLKTTVDKEVLAAEIKALENKLLQIQDARKDTTTALAMVEKSEWYVQHFPADSLSPYLLFRAGDVARGARKTEKAITLWSSVWQRYQDHRIAPKALFAQAFTYDSQLGKPQEAERFYRKFAELYPNHQLMPQVSALLKSVNKSPTELVKEFEKSN